jgi:hypothetical protein
VSLHPLLELSVDNEVRKAAGFRAVAARLTGAELGAWYREELANAPRRREAGKRYFVAYNSRLASERRPGRDGEHLSLALAAHQRGAGPLELPDDEGSVAFLQAQIPLKSGAEDPARGAADPNVGVGKLDLLGAGPDARMVACQVRYLAKSASRGGTGDTPLRALLEGLGHAAIAAANQAALQAEIDERGGPRLAEAPPLLVLLGSPRYWELCRRREAQKGAAWIKELERLAREIEEAVGVRVLYLACALEGDPGWSYAAGTPALDAPPRLLRAWEYGAGRVRPRPRPRPKAADSAAAAVEADLSRPIRGYSVSESYAAGDRIEHKTLGLGVVQGIAGDGKISVLFGERKSVLVHQRPGARRTPASAPPASDAPPPSD